MQIIRILFGYPLAIVRAILAFIAIPIFILIYGITVPIWGHNAQRAFKLRKAYINYLMPIFGMYVTTEGRPIGVPAIYVSNHISFTDPVATCSKVDAFAVAKAEIANIPLLAQGAELTGIIFVKRENKESRSNTRQAIVDTIKSGKNILVYPEGTVSGDTPILPYRMGVFSEAAREGIPVVPIALSYRDSKDRWVNVGLVTHFFRQLSYLRTRIHQVIGPMMTDTDPEKLKQQAEDWTRARLNYFEEVGS